MKKIIGVIGDADIENDEIKQKIAYDIGKLIIDNGYILATGGLNGVMKYASKGARSSSNYTMNSIIGLLPGYDGDEANEYVDVKLPTGLGIARNTLLISISNAIIVIGGGAGTLNEVALAWQMNKLIVSIKNVEGWSSFLAGKSLDKRREDIIYEADSPEVAIDIINKFIPHYSLKKFYGIKKKEVDEYKAKNIIKEFFNLKKELILLGKGSEGFVFKDIDEKYVYKIIYKADWYIYSKLLAFSECIEKFLYLNSFFKIKVYFEDKNNYILIKYPYEKTYKFTRNLNIHKKSFIKFLKDFKKIGWVYANFKPSNIGIKEDKSLILYDYGNDLIPFSNYLFESMCRKIFVCYKLQNIINPSLMKPYFTLVKSSEDFTLICKDFNLKEEIFREEYKLFLEKVKIDTSEDILYPIILYIFSNYLKKAKTLFDYGSGKGEKAKFLSSQLGLKVYAYEPNQEFIEKNKKNYKNITILKYSEIVELIEKGKKFDVVFCSLVLCINLDEDKNERLKEIDKILKNIKNLSKKDIIIIICNPLYNFQTISSFQKRIIDNNFLYENECRIKKIPFSSNKERIDYHRPLSFYESLFKKHNLKIIKIFQSTNYLNNEFILNSDFIVFLLEHKDTN